MRHIPFDRLPRAQAGVLFGRDAQLNGLVERLRCRENTCVWGPAGFGKTALAAEALWHVVGETGETLAQSPFPNGVVVLDLYRLKTDESQVWHLLADKFAPEVSAELPPRARATQACKGQRALVIIDGAEETRDGQTLQNLLSVLDHTTTLLILTRSMAQAYYPHAIHLADELEADDAIALLTRLTAGHVNHAVLAAVVKAIGGHPLALTWAGCQLALGEEPPIRFLAEMQRERLPGLHQPGYEGHTMKWLYERSARMIGNDGRRVLCAAGLLAAAPFGVRAAIAALGRDPEATDAEIEHRAYEALRQLTRHGLLRVAAGGDESWEFTHALAARFAREKSSAARVRLGCLCRWATAALEEGEVQVRQTGEFSRLHSALLHALALLAHDTCGRDGWLIGHWLLREGQDLFFALGRLASARDSVAAVESWMQRVPETSRVELSWQREFSMLLDRKGDIQRAQGDLAGARDSYRQSRDIRGELAARDPDSIERQRELSVSVEKLGDVQKAQGNLVEAQDSYESSRCIRETLAKNNPTNDQCRHDLGTSNERIGAVLRARGDLKGALIAFQRQFEISRRLAENDPTHSQWQRSLSASLINVGDIKLDQRDLEGARVSYESSCSIRRQLVTRDSSNTQSQRDLNVSLARLGDVQLEQRDLAGARESYQNSREIAERLAADDPTNTQWQRDLGVSLEKLGDVQWEDGDMPGARDFYQSSHNIREKLANSDPTNAHWQRDVSISLIKLGDVQLAQNDLARAREAYEDSRRITERLAAGDPTNTEWQRDLAASHARLGETAARAKDCAGARREFTRALSIMEHLCQLDPTHVQWCRDVEELRADISDLPSA